MFFLGHSVLVMANWLSGSALVSINVVVTLRLARLILGWVTVSE